MKCRIILELLAILFFTGCYNREQISRLDEAEALLQNKPDSAFTILQQLKPEGRQAGSESGTLRAKIFIGYINSLM